MNGSALPDWVLQVLPPWFLKRPAFTEAIWAGAITARNLGTTVLSVLYVAASADGHVENIGQFANWIYTHGGGSFVGLVFIAYRASQAAQKAAKGS